MKIYKVSQDVNIGYDTYDSMIVVANNEEEAKRLHPSIVWEQGGYYDEEKKEFWSININGGKYLFENNYGSWTNNLDDIEVNYIGEASENFKEKQVILSSFNAG